MQPVKDIRLEVKVRNNLILSKMDEMGIETVAELCRQMNKRGALMTPPEPKVAQTKVGELINMKESARKDGGEWVPLAIRLSDFFKCMPEDLFSEPQQWNKLEKNRSQAEVTYAEIQQLTARTNGPVTPEFALQATELRNTISMTLSTLTPREERIIRLRFGFDGDELTLQEIGDLFGGLSRDRIMQIEAKALRKLKMPSRSKQILKACGKLTTRRNRRGQEFERLELDPDIIDAL